MQIKTSDHNSIIPVIKKLNLPKETSHKGENGKILIIGGSSLFHAASIWAAEIASYFVDIVHYCSTKENEEIFLSLKKKFLNGIVIPKKKLYQYVEEDDVILLGPGMMRQGKEGKYTYDLTKKLIEKFPYKKYVFDAGSLQMMDKNWLLKLIQKPIITPHQGEFERLFKVSLFPLSLKEKVKQVELVAKKYKTIVLLKAVSDIVSDGEKTFIIHGGNAGLTKGGTGDILAGMIAAFYSKNEGLESAVIASYLLKATSDFLFKEKGYWYNINDIINTIPKILKKLIVL